MKTSFSGSTTLQGTNRGEEASNPSVRAFSGEIKVRTDPAWGSEPVQPAVTYLTNAKNSGDER
jgi:hypothetical protein